MANDGGPAANRIEAIDALAAVSSRYPAIFCDVWGVVHDGVVKHPAAEAALLAARDAGARVVLLTNSPRPSAGVVAQLDGLRFSRAAYDLVVTSGDVTRSLIAAAGRRLFHIGPPRNEDVFDGCDIELVGPEEAEAAVATGLYDDETETPADYADLLGRLLARRLPMVCANPDVVVHRGSRLVFCAGAIARDFAAIGGEVRMAGKPYRPIYDFAAEAIGGVRAREVLAVGDGLNTDIRGANAFGADALLIVGGVHGVELGGSAVAAPVLGAMLAEKKLAARFCMPMLR